MISCDLILKGLPTTAEFYQMLVKIVHNRFVWIVDRIIDGTKYSCQDESALTPFM